MSQLLDLSTAERIRVANQDAQAVIIGGQKIWDRPTLYSPWVLARTNRVLNPEIANTSNPFTAWTNYFSPVRTIVPSDGPTGGNAIQVSYSTGNIGVGQRGTTGMAVGTEPLNTPFRIIARVKAPAGRRYRISLNRDASGAGAGATEIIGNGTWQETVIDAVSASAVATVAANVLIINLDTTVVAGDWCFTIDSVLLEYGTTGQFFSGLTPDSELVRNSWASTDSNSWSTQETRTVLP